MSRKEVANWAAIRRAYEERGISVKSICSRFGVTSSKLYARAREERWEMRSQTGVRPSTLVDTEQGFSQMLEKATGRVRRHLDQEAGESVADLEREVRIVKSLVSTAKLVNQMEDEEGDGGDASSGCKDDNCGEGEVRGTGDGDADAIRRELARRIHKLGPDETD